MMISSGLKGKGTMTKEAENGIWMRFVQVIADLSAEEPFKVFFEQGVGIASNSMLLSASANGPKHVRQVT